MGKKLHKTPWGQLVSEKAITAIDLRLKEDPDVKPQWKELDGQAEVRGDRTEVSVITKQTVDLDGEVVLTDKVDRELFMTHPRVIWDHDYHVTPIGHCAWLKPDVRDNTPVLLACTKYRENHDLADDVWACITHDPCLLPHKSIGFLSRRRPPTKDELNDHPDWKGATVCDDALLLEYSCVVLPANMDCVLQAVGKSLKSPQLIQRVKDMPKKAKKDFAKALEKLVEERIKQIDADDIVREVIRKIHGR